MGTLYPHRPSFKQLIQYQVANQKESSTAEIIMIATLLPYPLAIWIPQS